MENGYSYATSHLSWIRKEKFRSWAFKDENLLRNVNRSGLRAVYLSAHNCPHCSIVVVDYSEKFDRKAVERRLNLALVTGAPSKGELSLAEAAGELSVTTSEDDS